MTDFLQLAKQGAPVVAIFASTGVFCGLFLEQAAKRLASITGHNRVTTI